MVQHSIHQVYLRSFYSLDNFTSSSHQSLLKILHIIKFLWGREWNTPKIGDCSLEAFDLCQQIPDVLHNKVLFSDRSFRSNPNHIEMVTPLDRQSIHLLHNACIHLSDFRICGRNVYILKLKRLGFLINEIDPLLAN